VVKGSFVCPKLPMNLDLFLFFAVLDIRLSWKGRTTGIFLLAFSEDLRLAVVEGSLSSPQDARNDCSLRVLNNIFLARVPPNSATRKIRLLLWGSVGFPQYRASKSRQHTSISFPDHSSICPDSRSRHWNFGICERLQHGFKIQPVIWCKSPHDVLYCEPIFLLIKNVL